MQLSNLLAALPDELATSQQFGAEAERDPLIRGITYDSRKVSPGDLFIALRGSVSDGHDYLERAIALGAVALLLEAAPDKKLPAGCTAAVVPDTRRALAHIATRFFGEPSKEVTLIGITGTNGKTSTSYLVESILAKAHKCTGLIGTVEVRFAGVAQPAVNTTPESLDLQSILRRMRTQNVDSVVMEVSSHGLKLERVCGCEFQVAAITNVTQDHLDFHGDMESYLSSKLLLFGRYLARDGTAVVNLDDASASRFIDAARAGGARVIQVTRNLDLNAEVKLLNADVTLSGSHVQLALPSGVCDFELPLVGDFNLENLLVACGICVALDIAPEIIAEGVAACPQVPGRMEVVGAELANAPTVIVDYAHTPDAVEKLLTAIRPLSDGRLITVFGCGGDRDRSKRPLMAEAVARHSDRTLATSDNPRTEDPLAILNDVEKGLGQLDRVEPEALDASERSYAVVSDRREAIACAMSIARPEDTVILAGKGHEDYQIIGSTKLPFDDREEARSALSKWETA
ncbi:MAG: UDP-N-acetylmuramoyl-L-alanyl-D-glutamate--2,6-diaminopimelate ligase [Myxococcales bacterium]|nr:UDP-N-acetylmuramoyl-L-alanyl-D-glutamate--2,6-diaminopimelate ligase [Myxococcales bacterium]